MELAYFLMRVNDGLTIGVGITAFALVLYFYFYNRESQVSRAFIGLLSCVIVVYLMDLLLTNIANLASATLLLQVQWIGIAFTPTFYLAFVRAIRQSVLETRFPSWLRPFSLGMSVLVVGLVTYTDWLVSNGTLSVGAFHLQPSILFYPFASVFILITVWGLRATLSARERCYTRTARRRMTYLSIGFIAPALGVFPYLLLIGWPTQLPGTFLWLLLSIGNVAVAIMLMMMAYSIAFIGTLTPERVTKHRLVHFLLRGPTTAIVALGVFGLGWMLEPLLHLGPFTLSLIAMAAAIIVMQLSVELAKPLIDLALYRQAHTEVVQVQELSQRLLTTADLQQFLENVLAALCELLHSKGGFLTLLDNGQLTWDVWCDLRLSPDACADIPLAEIVRSSQQERIVFWDGYWVIPIYNRTEQELLGLAGLQAPEVTLPLTTDQTLIFDQLCLQAMAALEDRRVQQRVFDAFSPLLPEMQDIQRRGGILRYAGAAVGGFLLTESAELPQWVHDALAHYWGGPRLTKNPLLDLEVVKRAAAAHGGNTVKGLRTILAEAIEQLRPDGERKLTAPEWLLYNILELKFLRGHKVREVAMRVAVSESDFYRKQRIAMQNLAHIIVEMEEQAHQNNE